MAIRFTLAHAETSNLIGFTSVRLMIDSGHCECLPKIRRVCMFIRWFTEDLNENLIRLLRVFLIYTFK